MNYDCIFSFGCSHIFGDGHKFTAKTNEPSTSVYPAQIANYKSTPHKNFSESGASNQSILSQILIAEDYARQEGLNPLYWIQWTYYTRSTVVSLDLENKITHWPYANPWNILKKETHSDSYAIEWANHFYKAHDQLSFFMSTCNCIIMANELLKNNLVKNCFAQSWGTKLDANATYSVSNFNFNIQSEWRKFFKNQTKNKTRVVGHSLVSDAGDDIRWFDPYISLLWRKILTYKWFTWSDDFMQGFTQWARERKFSTTDGVHYDETAHEFAGKYIIEKGGIA